MKNIVIFTLALLAAATYRAQTTTENFVKATTCLDADCVKKQVTVQYFDGLGRAKQVVNVKASPLGKDVVNYIEYDQFGRQVKDYLPVPQSVTQNGAIYITPLANASSVYGGEKIFAEKVLESSPLNRLQEQIQPGTAWSTKSIKFGYDANAADEVKKYSVTTIWENGASKSSISGIGTYGANQLYKNTVTDEDGNITIEYKNGKGQTVLVRKMLNSTEKADTYYVYNNYNQLALVIPPLASVGTMDQTVLDNLCYQYRYDGDSRLVEKKLPGKGWEYMLYDKQDRLVATQDAELKKKGQWLYTKYDKFGRVAITGISTGSDRNTEQTEINGISPNNVNRIPTVFFNRQGMDVYYDTPDSTYPNSSKWVTLLSLNYYDTYPGYSFNPGFPSTIYGKQILTDNPATVGKSTKSLPVLSLVKNIEDDNWTKMYSYYDMKGRVIGTHTINHLGGYTKTESDLDFAGMALQTKTYHKKLSTDPEKIITETFTYDDQNRLKTHKHKIDNNPEEILAQNEYNELSQLAKKKVGGTNIAVPYQTIDYAYNIRGWMTQINDPDNLGGDLFGYRIKYNQVQGLEIPDASDTGLKVLPKFNGNIAEIDWKTSTQENEPLKRYGYVYDGLNRLSAGFYQNSINPSLREYYEKITYDLNGNIKTLKRTAGKIGTTVRTIDDLTYSYFSGNASNRLQKVTETVQIFSGYPYTAVPTDIGYDDNGNMTSQVDKGISSIQYNYLNLPKQITQNAVSTNYTYRADGVKVKKLFGSVETHYLDGFQYKYTEPWEDPNGTMINPEMKLRIIPTSEGYYDSLLELYIYNYTDHLGNVRLSYADTNHDGIIQGRDLRVRTCTDLGNGEQACVDTFTPGEVAEVNNYYPFGLLHDYSGTTQNAYQYKYNGKELQETGMYDYGARFYMPDLGRWGVQDPLSEKFFDSNNYNYVLNNPIKFVDKDGMDVYLLNEEGKFILAKKQAGDDLVYGYNSKTKKINDNNGDKKGDYRDGIRIKTKGLVGQLRFYRDGNKDDQYQAYHQSIKEYSSQVEDDMFNLFHYAANNAKNVEFSLIDFNLGKKRYLSLQTYNDSGFSPGSGQIGREIKTNAEYHNHPFKTKYEEDYTEINSMGSRGNGIYYGAGGDYRNTVDYNVNFPNYVFFPKSTNLYNVTKTGIYLIKKINNDSKNFKK
ncbi:hypothetical protein ATE47_12460 [Chryseobacterium sp. IHB B 17019]|uniref:DUF6443 domain-containing protein n=1 Tax=Chryseobacterium sp. IHB B 17019 TaxID=1721091 RepID=UPI00071F67B1|nr:DUF6443 domain-containing protein [Chryseobacterium sp. IHB B 17019]ALR31285.1 hypothetical protein ATE47_12460 [Chryseobacterium sp. IHB B 17019]